MGEITEFRVLDDRPRDWFHGAHSQDPRHIRVGQAGQKSDLSYLVRRTSAPYVARAHGHASDHQSRRIRHRVLQSDRLAHYRLWTEVKTQLLLV